MFLKEQLYAFDSMWSYNRLNADNYLPERRTERCDHLHAGAVGIMDGCGERGEQGC